MTEDTASRANRELKIKATLHGIGARVHVRLHDALAHRVGIYEFGQVPDCVVHDFSSELAGITSSGKGGLNRVVHIQLIDGVVYFAAL